MQYLKKKPIQIYIEPKQYDMLEVISKNTGVSKAAVIRKSVEKYLENLPLEKDPAMDLMSLGCSSNRDLAEKHDKYLVKYHLNKNDIN